MTAVEDAWTRIGLLLGILQHAEHAINVSLAWVFTDQPVTLEQIAFFKPSKQKSTLGALLRKLRERANVDDEFDDFVTTFLEDRNRFVHRLFTEDGYNLSEAKDVAHIREFVDSLTDRSTIVLAAFHAFIEIWAEENALADDHTVFHGAAHVRQMIDHFKRHITR